MILGVVIFGSLFFGPASLASSSLVGRDPALRIDSHMTFNSPSNSTSDANSSQLLLSKTSLLTSMTIYYYLLNYLDGNSGSSPDQFLISNSNSNF